MTKQAYIFIGRYGAGKGTQAKLILDLLAKKAMPTIYVETGAEFRKFIATDNYTARQNADTVNSGGLTPVFMPIYIWSNFLISRYTGMESLVFDGTPRKPDEAKILETIFPFYGLGKPWVIYLDVEHHESTKRLSLRAKSQGRADDNAEAFEKRKLAYEADVIPTIEWYRTNPNINFLDIDGERSIEEIHADIVKQLGLE